MQNPLTIKEEICIEEVMCILLETEIKSMRSIKVNQLLAAETLMFGTLRSTKVNQLMAAEALMFGPLICGQIREKITSGLTVEVEMGAIIVGN